MASKPKPELDGFYKMIELAEFPANEILYIGDNPKKDISPAKKVGILAGMIYGQSEEADYNFKNFEEIVSLVNTSK